MVDSPKVFAVLVSWTLVLGVLLPVSGLAKSLDWSLGDFTVVNGTAESTGEGLVLKPDPSGKVFLTLAVPGLDLSRYQIVRFTTRSAVPLTHFLVWQTEEQGDQQFQFRIPPPVTSQDTAVLDMTGRPRWEGRAVKVGLGLIVPGGQSVLLRGFRLHSPGLAYDAALHLEEWAGYIPWQVSDNNFYSGTTGYKKGVPPVPLVAGLLAVLLVAYFTVQLLRGRLASFNWLTAGGVVLVAWLFIDLMWQYRLVERARVTLGTYGGKDGEELLLATPDAQVVRLVSNVRPFVEGDNPRVFIASRSEYHGVLGAYYLAPLNTYRNSRGRDMVRFRYLKPGDYVLLISPSLVPVDPQRGILHFPNGKELPVEILYTSAAGRLLRMI